MKNWLQILVPLLAGVFGSLLGATVAANKLVTDIESKLEVHIAQNVSSEAQIRKDIARIEQDNLQRDRDDKERDATLNKIKTDVAVIRQIIENL